MNKNSEYYLYIYAVNNYLKSNNIVTSNHLTPNLSMHYCQKQPFIATKHLIK